jgi:hypothetical protein
MLKKNYVRRVPSLFVTDSQLSFHQKTNCYVNKYGSHNYVSFLVKRDQHFFLFPIFKLYFVPRQTSCYVCFDKFFTMNYYVVSLAFPLERKTI